MSPLMIPSDNACVVWWEVIFQKLPPKSKETVPSSLDIRKSGYTDCILLINTCFVWTIKIMLISICCLLCIMWALFTSSLVSITGYYRILRLVKPADCHRLGLGLKITWILLGSFAVGFFLGGIISLFNKSTLRLLKLNKQQSERREREREREREGERKERTIKLHKKKETIKSGRRIRNRYLETKAWSLTYVHCPDLLCERPASCLSTVSQPLIYLSFYTPFCDAEALSLQTIFQSIFDQLPVRFHH